MTINGHGGPPRASGTQPFIKVGKPGMTDDLDERPRPCAKDTWCMLLAGHGGACELAPEVYGPKIPPAGWYLTLPAPRPWCRFCGKPVPVAADDKVVEAHLDATGAGCAGGGTPVADHPKFRG